MQRYYLPNKFGVDKRKSHYSSMIISGQMTREEALQKLAEPLYEEADLQKDLSFILKELSISEKEFEKIMNEPPRQHSDYRRSIINRGAQVLLKMRQKSVGY